MKVQKDLDTSTFESAKDMERFVQWKSPSNIALIKYWGKRPGQIPQNPSLSFTLSAAYTITSVKYCDRSEQDKWINFKFEGRQMPSFESRITKYLASLTDLFPFLNNLSLNISSQNSFPHSSGIASSASGMSALALCICEIEEKICGSGTPTDFYRKASEIARLGSGSAARSVFPNASLWGKTGIDSESSDNYGVQFNKMDELFKTFHDDILIVSSARKSVTSSVGHELMNGNPYASSRYRQANDNLENLIMHLKTGDLMSFGNIVENEALTLHSLMMSSDPSFILMKPDTLHIINKIRAYRKETGVPVFFTLDAGPNVHVLYPDSFEATVKEFIDQTLVPHTEEGMIIRDRIGGGPVNMVK